MKRFWDKVNKTETCWIWTAAKLAWGYGSFGLNGKTRRAHRVAWELLVGPIPEGKILCHKCDAPACVNPDHLFVGTISDNSKDMVSKGRQARGYRIYREKFLNTHCCNGHEYTIETTYWYPGNLKRDCLTCRVDYNYKSMMRRREIAVSKRMSKLGDKND